jgi:putative addiction module component (TIGR02574 family)
MTEHTQSLLREALSLPEAERADLVAELLVSLDGPPEGDDAAVEQAWADELEGRARRVSAGESQGEAWTDVRDRVRRALTDG